MRSGFVLLLGLAGIIVFVTNVVNKGDDRAAAAGTHRRIVPGVAADSARPPTPLPTPIYDTERWVKVQVRITALELAVTESGTLPVAINATAKARFPGPFDAPITVPGQFSVTDEGTDALCDWSRVDVSTDFKMTVYYNSAGNLDLLLSFVSPQWHYSVACKAGGPYRSPAFGEEGLELFLRDLMAPYRTNEVANGVRLPMNIVSSPTANPCIKRSAKFSMTGIQTTLAEVFVWVYQADWPGGCDPSVDLVTPLPVDDLAPLTP